MIIVAHKKVAIAACIIIVTLIAAALFIASPRGELLLRNALQDRIGKALHLDVRIDSFETDLLSSVHVGGIAVTYVDNGDSTTILFCESALIEYRLWRLFNLKPCIDSLGVTGLAVSLARDENGWRLPKGKKARSDSVKNSRPLDFRIRLRRLNIDKSSFTFDDTTIPLSLSSGDVVFHAAARGDTAYVFDASFGSWDARLFDKPLDIRDLVVEGSMDASSIFIDRCRLSAAGLACDFAGHVKLGGKQAGILGTAHIEGDIAPVAALFADKIPERLRPKEADLTADIALTGTEGGIELVVTAGIPVLSTNDADFRDILLAGQYRNRSATIDTLRIGLFDGTISGSGFVDADSLLNHSFTVSVDSVRLERILEFVYPGKSPYKGFIAGDIVTGGSLKHPDRAHAQADFVVRNIMRDSRKIAGFDAGLSYSDSLLTFELKQDGAAIAASVKIAGQAIEGAFNIHTTKPETLAGFAKVTELTGSLDIDGTIAGMLSKPSISADFSGRSLRYHGFPIDSVKGGVVYENGRAVLHESEFSGSLATTDSLTAPFRIDGLGGGLSYACVLSGDILDPDGHIDLRFDHPAFRAYGFDTAEAFLSIADRTIAIKRASIVKDSLAVDIGGQYSISESDGTVTMTFRKYSGTDSAAIPATAGEKGDLGTMNVAFDASKPDEMKITAVGASLDIAALSPAFVDSIDIRGLLDSNLGFSGNPRRPNGSLSLFIDAPQYKNVAVDSLRGAVSLNPVQLCLDDLSLYLNEQRTWANGTIELKSSGKFPSVTSDSRIECKAEGHDFIARIIGFVLPDNAVFKGSSTYNLSVSGTVGKPEINGDISMDIAELALKPGAPVFHDVSLKAVFMDSVFVLDSAEGLIKSAPFELRARIATANWTAFRTAISLRLSGKDVLTVDGTAYADSLDCTVKVHGLDLTLVSLLSSVPGDLAGTAFASFVVRGPYKRPFIEGALRVSEVSFLEPKLNLPFKQGRASLVFKDNTITLDSLFVTLNGGKIRSSGRLVYGAGGITDLEFALDGQKLKFEKRNQYSLAMKSASLTCKKTENFFDIDGDIYLDESHITADFQPASLLPFMKKAERPSQSPTQFMRQVRLNIRTRSGDKLWIDNNLAHLRIHSEVEIIGTVARPNAAGRLSVEEGYVLYLDRKFKINRGVMDFIDPNRLNPLIDFQAETSIKSFQSLAKTPYTVTIAVSGSLDKVTVELSSDPTLDKSDIIALLTVGATRDQLSGRSADIGDATFGDILKERAQILSSQRISSYFSRKVGGMLGLEEISVEGNLFDIGKTSGPQLIASEQISDRVGITFTTSVGHVNEQNVRLDYRLNRFFSVEGQTDQKGNAGLDLKYRVRFK